MAVSSKEAKLESQLTCAICLDRYNDPRMLPCAHSYCKDCIDRLPVELENGRRAVKCPTCRKPTLLEEEGASALPIAFYINNMMEIHSDELQKIDAKTPTKGEDSRQLCHTHENKPMDLYCETCRKHICFKCSTESHRDHQCDRAEDLYTKYKQQIEACLKPVKEQIDNVKQTLSRFDTREREMREQGEAVQREIDYMYHQLMVELQESQARLSQEAAAVLQEKLQLHSLQRASVEAVLEKLKSCCEFIEEELRSQSQYQILAAKKKLVKHINNTHSEVKVSDLQPAQEPNIAFTAALLASNPFGNITSKQSFLCRGLFTVNIPSHIMVHRQVAVNIVAPPSLTTSRLSCKLVSVQNRHAKPVECPVTSVGEGQFKVMIRSNTVGLHQLRVLVDGVDVYGSPFEFMAKWKRRGLERFARVNGGPMSVAVTNDGRRVMVTERDTRCVTVLSSTGKVVDKFDGHGIEFKNPWGIAVTFDKHILVTTITNRKLWKFDFSFNYEASFDIYSVGLAVHPVSGKVFCTNFTNGNITVLNADLTLSHSFDGDGLLSTPRGVAVDSEGMVYVADFNRGEVLKFTPEGKHLATIGSKGEQHQQFGRPCGICIDSDDIMYVTDETKHHVMVFATKGQYLGSLRRSGDMTINPCGVAVDKTGNIYMCDIASGEVLVSRPY